MAASTPWGQSQDRTVIERGLTFHSTAGHGGFLVGKSYAQKHLSSAAIKLGEKFGDYLAFEEDVATNVILLEIPAAKAVLSKPEGVTDQVLIKALSYYNAEYLLERGITPDPEAYQRFLDSKENDRRMAAKCPDLIRSALGVSGLIDGAPAKAVKVYTADGSKHFVTSASYDARTTRAFNNLSDCEKVQGFEQTSDLHY